MPGLTSAQRKAALRRLRQEARRECGPRLPVPQLAVALAADRVRVAFRNTAAVIRLHPVGSILPTAAIGCLVVLFVLASVSVRIIHRPGAAGSSGVPMVSGSGAGGSGPGAVSRGTGPGPGPAAGPGPGPADRRGSSGDRPGASGMLSRTPVTTSSTSRGGSGFRSGSGSRSGGGQESAAPGVSVGVGASVGGAVSAGTSASANAEEVSTDAAVGVGGTGVSMSASARPSPSPSPAQGGSSGGGGGVSICVNIGPLGGCVDL
jgi:hypothetical protein